MYVDGYIEGPFGEIHRISGLPTFQFTATSIVPDVRSCQSMDLKIPGDLIYCLGETRDELGGSEYYDLLGYVGLNVPRMQPGAGKKPYQALQQAIQEGWVASAHGIYRGGLGIHLALMALAGDLGVEVDLAKIPAASALSPERRLFSESCSRVILCVDPKKKKTFEKQMAGCRMECIGRVRTDQTFQIKDGKRTLIKTRLKTLRDAFHQTFGGLI
jgi:phosphoribosylformylglycinamidine synthase